LDDFEHLSYSCNRSDIVQRFWQENEERCGRLSEFTVILKDIIDCAHILADNEGLSPEEFESQLWEAEGIVDAISDALKYHQTDPPKCKFWSGFHASSLTQRPDDWSDVSPINPVDLDLATARYINCPWLQSDAIDWYLINAFMLDEILRYEDDFRSGKVLGRIDWAYKLGGGQFPYVLIWRTAFVTLNVVFGWLLLPGITIAALVYDYTTLAAITGGAFSVVMLVRLILFPNRFSAWLARRRLKKHLEAKLKHILDLYDTNISVATINPTLLKERMQGVERDFPFVRPVFYSILDRAIERDPYVLSLKH